MSQMMAHWGLISLINSNRLMREINRATFPTFPIFLTLAHKLTAISTQKGFVNVIFPDSFFSTAANYQSEFVVHITDNFVD